MSFLRGLVAAAAGSGLERFDEILERVEVEAGGLSKAEAGFCLREADSLFRTSLATYEMANPMLAYLRK